MKDEWDHRRRVWRLCLFLCVRDERKKKVRCIIWERGTDSLLDRQSRLP